jgi:hypothetical protein
MFVIKRNQIASMHNRDGGVYGIGASEPVIRGKSRGLRRQRLIERDPFHKGESD